MQALRLNRRRLMAGAVGLGLGAALVRGKPAPAHAEIVRGLRHLVWVWQFSADAEPNVVALKLRDHNLGIVLKTHDGLQWMAEYDKSPYAVSGPAQTSVLANYYENAGVPFHAWCVVQGVDPIAEARMAAEVIGAGARSLYLDLEPHSGFWRGTAADAAKFGSELRRLQPDARIVLSIDPRPWMIDRLPMAEFTAFGNEVAPQQYWRTFNTQSNYDRFIETGHPVPPEGVTPEFLLDTTMPYLLRYGLPITHVGQGNTPDRAEFQRFIDRAYLHGSKFVTVWRHGVTPPDIFSLLRDVPAIQPPAPVTGGGLHVVQSGDTLGVIASQYGVSVDAIAAANNLADPNYLYVGQQLTIPGGGNGFVAVHSAGASASAPATTSSGGRSYTVESGDTLYGIAGKYGTSVDAIATASGLTNPDFISIGQVLSIP